MVHLILTASYANEVYTLAFDPGTSSISIASSITIGHHPSWITFYPGDKSLVFTGLEQADGKAVVLKFDDEGKGKVVAEASSGGADPCSLLATKNELLIANVCPIKNPASMSRYAYKLFFCSTVLLRRSIHVPYFSQCTVLHGIITHHASAQGLRSEHLQARRIASSSSYHPRRTWRAFGARLGRRCGSKIQVG